MFCKLVGGKPENEASSEQHLAQTCVWIKYIYTIQYSDINVSLVSPPQHSDMNEEMRVETMELCVTACEKHSNNNEARMVLINIYKVPNSCFL